MGAIYGAVYFRTEDREAARRVLADVARKRRCRFLLGPALRGWVAAYPEMNGQDERVAKAIAKPFAGEALYVLVHDSDVFAYTCFRDGRVVDKYDSCPDYYEEAPPRVKERYRGRPERLVHLLAPGKTVAELQQLLSPNDAGEFVLADHLLDRFADLLGLPNALTSYEYLQADETEGTEGWGQFLHVPDDGAKNAREREAAARTERVKERMPAEGLLLLGESAPGAGLGVTLPVWCPDREGSGFLVCWARPGRRPTSEPPTLLERYAPPWADAAATGLVCEGVPQQLAPSPPGRLLAVGGVMRDWQVQVWDLDTRALLVEVRRSCHGSWCGFSADERFLVLLSSDGTGTVTELPSGRRVSSFQVQHTLRAAVHPSGVVLVPDSLGQLTFVDLVSGQVCKTLFVGGRQNLGPLHQPFAAQAQQAIAHVDQDALEQRMRAGLGKQIEEAVRLGMLPPGMTAEKYIEEFKQQLEKTIAQMRWQFQQRKHAGSSAFAAPERGNEIITCLECSADGRLVFAGTHKGVRVFCWDTLTTATENTPPPLCTSDAETVAVEMGHGITTTSTATVSAVEAGPGMTALHRTVYALAHDAAGNRLLFGGLEGKVGFLDLATGRRGTLLDPPGRPAIQRLGLSRDRSALCCTCQPDLFVQGKQRRPALFQVWNYAALEQRLAGT